MCICLAGAYQGRRNPWLTARYRQELLQWMNSLCSLNLTRVEQCGTGYEHVHHSTLQTPQLTLHSVRHSAQSTTASSVIFSSLPPLSFHPADSHPSSRCAHGSCQVQRNRRLCLPGQLQDSEQHLPQAPHRPPHPRRNASQVQDAGQPGVPAVDKALLGPALPWYAIPPCPNTI